MSSRSRGLILLACLGLGLTFFFPLWTIDLWAPQYPEGLGLKIWLTKMTGDLGNINLLNHYIGMHRIEPDSIAELRYFVYIFGALVALGVLAAAVGKKFLLHTFTVLLVVFSFWALFDFYMWEYKYGHELNPDAAIKIEGETYQPPLIGRKELANIEAWSLPDIGGYGHIVAVFSVLLASGLELRGQKKDKKGA